MIRKIEDRSGASLAVALLFFLVCAIVGSVLIAAASVSMGRMKNIDQGEQDRYAVDSAMNLISDRMSSENTLQLSASMPSRVLVQKITEKDDTGEGAGEENNSNYDDNGYNKQAFGSNWNLSFTPSETSSNLKSFRNHTAELIFKHYMESNAMKSSESSGEKLYLAGQDNNPLGIWNPSKDELDDLKSELANNDADKNDVDEFFFGTPDKTWTSIPMMDFQYLSAQRAAGETSVREVPLTLKISDKEQVNILFSMDAQFNITAVIYPYSKREQADTVSIPFSETSIYRVVMVPCVESSFKFNPNVEEEISEDKKTTRTYVKHTVELNIKWGDPVKTSVIPDKNNKSSEYPDFFPEQFRELAPDYLTAKGEGDHDETK